MRLGPVADPLAAARSRARDHGRDGRRAGPGSPASRATCASRVENYLSGAEIKAHAFSQTWCRSQYQASIDAYGARGVPKSRLVLTEHFGNTKADKPWGRGGVSDADWARAIRVRAAAARALHFAGFASYAWAFNWVHEEIAQRLEYEALYGTLALP